MTLMRIAKFVVDEDIKELQRMLNIDQINNIFIPTVIPGKHIQLIFPTPIQLATYLSKYNSVKYFLSYKINPNEISKAFGLATIHLCMFNNDVEMLRTLVNAGANVNLVGSEGETPLFIACYVRAFECVLELLKMGANPNGSEEHASALNPLQIAVSKSYPEIVATLMRHGAKHDNVSYSGCAKVEKIKRIIEGDYEKDDYDPEKLASNYSVGLLVDANEFELPDVQRPDIDKRYTNEEYKKELKDKIKVRKHDE